MKYGSNRKTHNEKNDKFFDDQPLEDFQKDLFGYVPIAENIAKSILAGSFPNGFVIAIQGPWGSGKTTMLNFIRCYLERSGHDTKPIIVQFNPWWFSGSKEGILLNFFGQLSVAMGKSFEIRKILQKILKIGAILFQHVSVQLSLSAVSEFIKTFVEKVLKTSDDIFKLKGEVSEGLKRLKRKLVVFIDDIDRLHPEEMKQLFMIVRAVADFPNTVYLLAFDRNVVANSIGNEKVSGEDYLQKLVQMPVDLPLIDDECLLRVLSEGIEKIFANSDQVLMDKKSMEWIVSLLIKGHFKDYNGPIRTLRGVYRLLNRLYLTYPVVKKDVIPCDFLTIEALSIFFPRAYDIVRSCSERFVDFGTKPNDPERDKEFYDEVIHGIKTENKETLQSLLAFLFPRVGSAYKDIEVARGNDSPRYLQSRICGEAFPLYFYNTQVNWVSNREVEEILSAREAEKIKDKLLKKEAPKIRFFLERLRGLVSELSAEKLWPLVDCLVRFGDDLVAKIETAGPVLVAGLAEFALRDVVLHSLRKLRSQPGYLDKMASIFKASESISTIKGIIAAIEESKIFPKNELEIFKTIVLIKLSKEKN